MVGSTAAEEAEMDSSAAGVVDSMEAVVMDSSAVEEARVVGSMAAEEAVVNSTVAEEAVVNSTAAEEVGVVDSTAAEEVGAVDSTAAEVEVEVSVVWVVASSAAEEGVVAYTSVEV